MLTRSFLAAVLCLVSSLAFADATVPTADEAGTADPAGLGRYEGAFIVEQQAKAYDEITLPLAALTPDPDDARRDDMNNRLMQTTSSLTLEGKLTRTVCVAGRTQRTRGTAQLPAGHSGERWPVSIRMQSRSLRRRRDVRRDAWRRRTRSLNYLFPKSAVSEKSFSNAACAVDMNLADLRYGVAKFSANGTDTHVAVLAYAAKDDLYCKALNERTVAIVVTLEAKAREQKMVTIRASELGQSIASSGKVAIYGIYFDVDKADLKPESKSQLDEIGALLRADMALKLVVAGHTDNQGGVSHNMELSKKRADAVVAALVSGYGVAPDRLAAQGMGSAAPVASNGDETGRAKNRRVELVKQ